MVERGHATAKIYRTPSNGSDQFTMVHYLGEKRVRKAFARYEEAVLEAEVVATKLCQGELPVLELKGEDRLACVRAVEALQGTGAPR